LGKSIAHSESPKPRYTDHKLPFSSPNIPPTYGQGICRDHYRFAVVSSGQILRHDKGTTSDTEKRADYENAQITQSFGQPNTDGRAMIILSRPVIICMSSTSYNSPRSKHKGVVTDKLAMVDSETPNL
jgi:hypothetical protein